MRINVNKSTTSAPTISWLHHLPAILHIGADIWTQNYIAMSHFQSLNNLLLKQIFEFLAKIIAKRSRVGLGNCDIVLEVWPKHSEAWGLHW